MYASLHSVFHPCPLCFLLSCHGPSSVPLGELLVLHSAWRGSEWTLCKERARRQFWQTDLWAVCLFSGEPGCLCRGCAPAAAPQSGWEASVWNAAPLHGIVRAPSLDAAGGSYTCVEEKKMPFYYFCLLSEFSLCFVRRDATSVEARLDVSWPIFLARSFVRGCVFVGCWVLPKCLVWTWKLEAYKYQANSQAVIVAFMNEDLEDEKFKLHNLIILRVLTCFPGSCCN